MKIEICFAGFEHISNDLHELIKFTAKGKILLKDIGKVRLIPRSNKDLSIQIYDKNDKFITNCAC